MWIMLTKKIAVEVSPPKLSLHWAEPWPHLSYAERTKNKKRQTAKFVNGCRSPEEDFIGDDDLYDINGISFNSEIRRCKQALGIYFLGEHIRVFPEEYSIVSDKNMEEYINLKEGSHILIEDNRSTHEQAPSEWPNKDKKFIYEAAILDGCTIPQAMRVMEELDPDISTVPVMGWYNARPEYASIFCSEEEYTITDRRIAELELEVEVEK